ncbi:hypothetical protein M413DRAFT_441688 [Hebeloma cylindrosporum]|uniref:C2H2-type domain-containing protein n=1 Tax=Hebeloma cylindrosporum TaxID=76867 RepID=A0A0C3CMP4_HEBCY|nr:hypothetical protein M413DRAFT_441688 [Hebeloma cylindrosporum h7]
MKNVYQTTVLGKRKAYCQLVLHLSPAPTSSSSQPDHSESDQPSQNQPIIINGQLVPGTKKCYRCTFASCKKAYSKPSRLEEHQRTHTGQRPFICETCGKSYLRDTHLHAHARSHLPEASRPLACERPNCEKRFWTSQHLQVHYSWHDGAKPYRCNEGDCRQAFAKHHLLRTHICVEHAPPGTKPYRCEHDRCTKSFDTNQHLKTHQKTHDDKRYTCVHVSCLANNINSPNFFPTWSALQSHIRAAHPPACSHPSCNGRTFASQANLRAHLKRHEQRETEQELDEGIELLSDSEVPSKKRRRGGECGRDWKCDFQGCGKEFKSKKALGTHTNVTHLGKRDFVCHYEDCKQSFGYKHLLQRHSAKVHQPTTDASEEEPPESDAREPSEVTFDIDAITGNTYTQHANDRVNSSKALRCPYPDIRDLTGDDAIKFLVGGHNCAYVFSRGYDLRRHLHATHDIEVSKESVDSWVRKQKKVTNS